jgi:hypothetical protein
MKKNYLAGFRFIKRMFSIRITSLAVLVITFLLSIVQVSAQDSDKYTLRFKSGNYTPEANIDEFINGKLRLDNPFNGKYYVVVQFEKLPDERTKSELSSRDIIILDFLTGTAFTARLNQSPDFSLMKTAGIRSVFILESRFKMDEGLLAGEVPEWAVRESGMVDLNVIPYEWISVSTLEADLKQKQARILDSRKHFNLYTIRVSRTFLKDLSNSPWLQWMESIAPPPQDDNVPGKALHRSNVLNDGGRNLTGDGVKMGIWDGGTVGPHIDFTGRLVLAEPYLATDHGTHVAGTMAGAGLIDPYARGMAPKALIYSYDYNGSVNTEVAAAISTYGITMTQNSWGYGDGFVNCTVKDPYNSNSREQDINIRNNPTLIHVHSSGNSQAVCTGGWGTTTGKAAKNKLVVANVNNSDVISSSSSFGPVQDGRLKPEISGMGTSVYSTLPNNTYTGGYSGTSMATPGVSGTIAQLVERYRDLAGGDPPASLMKAIACNTAKDLGNAGPDYKYGFGRINGLQAVRAIEAVRYKIDSLSTGANNAFNITVPANTLRLKVMICWTDPAGAANSNPALVNDLDLTVTDPSLTSWNPWVLNPASPANVATRAADHLNNIEQVTLDNPAAGTYSLNVAGYAVPVGSKQVYSITWEIESAFIEITYPNGGEVFVPGSAEILYWDHLGVTSTQTLQYSTNNGSSWTTISSSLSSTTSRYSWTVPTVASSQVRIRVTSGSLTDMSDAAFSILGTPGSLTLSAGCSSGEVNVSWASVTNATHYDVIQINEPAGGSTVVLSNVSSLSANISAPSLIGSTVFYTVRARNNTNSIIGKNAIAKSIVVPGGAVTPLVSPAGPQAVCSGDTLILSGQLVKANAYATASIPFAAYVPTGDISVTLTDDEVSAALPIGFTFNFYGNSYSTFHIGSNGIIGFTSASLSAYTPQTLPSATSPNDLIAFAWTDLNPSSGGSITYFTSGTAPNRKLIVRFSNVNRYSSANTVDGRIELYEGTDVIEIHSSSVSSGTNTMGLENAAGNLATPVSGRNNSVWSIGVPEAVRFAPYNSTMVWQPGSVSGATRTVTNGGNYSFSYTFGSCTYYSDTLTVDNCPSLNLTAFIQGYYTGSAELAGILSPVVCDTVIVSLAQSSSPYTILYSDTSLLDTDGDVKLEFPLSADGGTYYLVLNHRNSLETWSSVPVAISTTGGSYDFSSAASSAYGNNLCNLGDGHFAIWSGDLDQDDIINFSDMTSLDSYIQQMMYGYQQGDLSGDNHSESADYSLLENNLVLNLQVSKP